MRLFVAIDLDDRAREAIGAEQRRVARAIDAGGSVKWVRPDHMHLTLAFLGEVAESATGAIVHALDPDIDVQPFVAGFEGFGVFPPEGPPRVFWLGVSAGAAAIVGVQRRVAARLETIGIPPEPRPFHPHLTLARWRLSRAADRPRAIALDPGRPIAEVAVGHIALYRSRLSPAGPTYTALTRATLT